MNLNDQGHLEIYLVIASHTEKEEAKVLQKNKANET